MRTNDPTPAGRPEAATVLRALDRTRRSVRSVLLVERIAQAVAFGMLAITVAAIVDRAFRLPPGIRAIELAALLAGGAWWLWTRVVPAARFAPPLVEVALRIERGRSEARGILATGADLAARPAADSDRSRELSASVVARASDVVGQAAHGRVDRRPALRATSHAAIAVGGAIILAWISPGTARTALLRLATPFADVQWPARTMVEAAMGSGVRPRGAALVLRARTVRGDPAQMRVEAEYRVLRAGAGEWRTVLLSAQPDGSFERLVDSDGDAVEVLFRTEDMETLPVTVRLVPAPGVERATARVVPPAYAASIVDERTIDLGDGTDRRATVSPPVLAGSRIELTLRMRGTSGVPPVGADRDAWLSRVVRIAAMEGQEVRPDLAVDPADPAGWTLSWSAEGRGIVELRPEGEEGIVPAERIAFEIPAVEDAAPVIAVIDPAADESVTTEAIPMVVAEARDDLRVERSWLEVTVVRGDGPPRHAFTQEGTTGASARVERAVEIRATGAQPGDRVVCTPHAIDGNERDGKRRDPVAGAPRVFRILSVGELAEQVRSRLGQLRDAASRLREEQAGIAEAIQGAGERTAATEDDAASGERAQLAGTEGRMADRIGAMERTLDELGDRLARNKADEGGISETVREAVESARAASEQASKASAAAQDRKGMREAADRAQAAERMLADLEATLQRDRESAELSRRIDRLGEAVESARRETQEAAQGSVGKSREQLAEDARSRLDRAAQAQREAAGEARRLADDLAKRAEDLERRQDAEPGAAEAMREATQEAERRGLARQLEQAARQTEQNQAQGAQESQRQAADAVRAMQQAMRNQQGRRAEELERRMVDVLESIRGLLAAIGERSLPMQRLSADAAADADREAQEIIRLSRNAAGIAERAAGAGPTLRRPGSLVERASTQLDASAGSLREVPPALEPARASFDSARRSVEEALAVAEQAKRDAERAAENRRREELRGIYERILEVQRSARAGAEAVLPPPGKRLDRRGFIESRRVAAEQGQVSGLLEAAGGRADVSGSELYSASNQEMLAASRLASQDLVASALSRRTMLLQREVELALGSLIEALGDPPEPDDPFAQAPGRQRPDGPGGGGQGGGAERVPPMAELRLLRSMAQRVLDDTAAASELPDSDRAAYLGRVAERQRRITELGERWMKEMQKQSGQAPEGEGTQQPGGTP